MINGQQKLDALCELIKAELDQQRPYCSSYEREFKKRLSACTSIPFVLTFEATPEDMRCGRIGLRAVVKYD